MIKYLGSKRTLVPQISRLAEASGAKTALDLFTGTTRVARAFKQAGLVVTASDLASYSYAMAKAWIELDAQQHRLSELQDEIARLNNLPSEPGYFTETFCENARFFQPKNGARVDVTVADRTRGDDAQVESVDELQPLEVVDDVASLVGRLRRLDPARREHRRRDRSPGVVGRAARACGRGALRGQGTGVHRAPEPRDARLRSLPAPTSAAIRQFSSHI